MTEQTYDRSAALERVGGDEELLEELHDSFRAELDGWLQALGEAVERRDAESVGETAHTIKGSADTIGAVEVTELARQLEQQGRTGELKEVDRTFEQLQTALDRLEQQLP